MRLNQITDSLTLHHISLCEFVNISVCNCVTVYALLNAVSVAISI